MSRAVVDACLPWLGLLAGAGIVLVLLVRLAGARFQPGRLAQVHGDEGGGTQALSFVITLPFFILIAIFMLQLVQLMIGTIVVHYAAFAAARAAIVWIPARVVQTEADLEAGQIEETENRISVRSSAGEAPITDLSAGPGEGGADYVISVDINDPVALQSPKARKIFTAAVLGCLPISPSAAVPSAPSDVLLLNTDRLIATYQGIAQNLSGTPASAGRLQNKLNYAASHTRIELRAYHQNESPDVPLLEGVDRYDPVARMIPRFSNGVVVGYDYYWRPFDEFRPNELGWQDTITVTVRHDLALFGSAGILSSMVSMIPRVATSVYGPITVSEWASGPQTTRKLTLCTVTALATLGLEGEKCSIPYPCVADPVPPTP